MATMTLLIQYFKNGFDVVARNLHRLAVQNKSGDIPAHDKNAQRNTYNGSTQRIYLAQVFRRKKQGICTITFHKTTVDGTTQYIPEYQQYLELSEMKNKKLNRKRSNKYF